MESPKKALKIVIGIIIATIIGLVIAITIVMIENKKISDDNAKLQEVQAYLIEASDKSFSCGAECAKEILDSAYKAYNLVQNSMTAYAVCRYEKAYGDATIGDEYCKIGDQYNERDQDSDDTRG